jgi:hypothetical protein
VVEGTSDSAQVQGSPDITLAMLVDAGLSLKQASGVIAQASGRGRREVYQEAVRARGKADESDDE